jgi:hypothetical protein
VAKAGFASIAAVKSAIRNLKNRPQKPTMPERSRKTLEDEGENTV